MVAIILVLCYYCDSEIKELKNRLPWTSSALLIKIYLIKVFSSFLILNKKSNPFD